MPMARMRSAAACALHAGLSCPVGKVDLKALKTLPPKPYTQGELIKAMKTVAKFVTDPRLKQKLRDTTGIGTEATRANIINGLIGRGYRSRKAVPSALPTRHSRLSTRCPRPSPTPAPRQCGSRRST